MALFQSGCDYCGSERTSDGRGLYMSTYKYQHDWGSAKVFCSYPCLENYKERLVRDKELKKQNEIDDKEREKEIKLQKSELENERTRAIREKKNEELKNDIVDAAVLIKNSYQKQTKNVSFLQQLWNILIIVLVISFLLSKIFHIDVRKFF